MVVPFWIHWVEKLLLQKVTEIGLCPAAVMFLLLRKSPCLRAATIQTLLHLQLCIIRQVVSDHLAIFVQIPVYPLNETLNGIGAAESQ